MFLERSDNMPDNVSSMDGTVNMKLYGKKTLSQLIPGGDASALCTLNK